MTTKKSTNRKLQKALERVGALSNSFDCERGHRCTPMNYARFLHQRVFGFLLLLISICDGRLEAANLTLSWNDNSNSENGFGIERMAPGDILAQIATVGANITSYTDANLTSGLNYCYIVRAFNAAGVSDASNVACAVASEASGSTTPNDTPTSAPTGNGGTGNIGSGSVTNLSNDPVDARSTRGAVLTGDNVMIAGFIITGDSAKTMLIRARGPTLADLGVSDVLHDPVLRVFSGQTVLAQNDNWRDTQEQAIAATGLDPCQPFDVGGSTPTECSRESAVLITLNPGAYTAIVSGVAGETGIGLVEIYEVDNTSSRLVNMSTRGRVGTGDNVMIGGFIIEGSAARTLVLRARGPSLTDFGVNGVLQDPVLQLYSGQTVIARNDNWQTPDPLCGTASCGAATQITNLGLDLCQPFTPGGSTPAGCSRESAILITLNPGPYTTIVSGSGGSSGVALVELYEVD